MPLDRHRSCQLRVSSPPAQVVVPAGGGDPASPGPPHARRPHPAELPQFPASLVSLADVISLRARLGVSTALVIAAVVGLSTYLQARIVARAVEAEALDAAAAIALGVSADLGEHTQAPSTAELVDLLADYRKAVPAVRSITVTAADAAVDRGREPTPPAAAGDPGWASGRSRRTSPSASPTGRWACTWWRCRSSGSTSATARSWSRWGWTRCGACRTRAGRRPSCSRRWRSCCW